jgi:hypothetical protein
MVGGSVEVAPAGDGPVEQSPSRIGTFIMSAKRWHAAPEARGILWLQSNGESVMKARGSAAAVANFQDAEG